MMVEEMTSIERMTAVLDHEIPDRVPIFLMGSTIGAIEAGVNVPEFAVDGTKMAEGYLNFINRYGVDAVLPGAGIAPMAEFFGTTTKYYNTKYDPPVIGEPVVKRPEDWEKLEVTIVPESISASLEANQLIRDKTDNTVAVLGYIPSPLTLATWVARMSDVLKHSKKYPEELHKGLSIIAEVEKDLVSSQIALGSNIFLMSCTRASREIFTDKQYSEFGIPYDLEVLESFKDKNVHVLIHACGNYPMVNTIIEKYPISALNWWDRGTEYSLRDMKEKYDNKVTLVGGLDQNRTLIMGTPKDAEEEAKDAIRQAATGGGFILSGGCEIGATTPPENILAAVNAAKKYGKYSVSL